MFNDWRGHLVEQYRISGQEPPLINGHAYPSTRKKAVTKHPRRAVKVTPIVVSERTTSLPVVTLTPPIGKTLYKIARAQGARLNVDVAGRIYFDLRVIWQTPVGDPAMRNGGQHV